MYFYTKKGHHYTITKKKSRLTDNKLILEKILGFFLTGKYVENVTS